jgi:hypothetical protein
MGVVYKAEDTRLTVMPAPKLAAVVPGEVGAEILLRIAREFDKSMEWLLTGEDRPYPSYLVQFPRF